MLAYGACVLLFVAARALAVPRPRRMGLAARIAMIPLDRAPLHHDVRITWDAHHIPHIEAQDAHDLAVALGVVHAHLRLGQMTLMRRIAQGRISEMLGPLALRLDQTIHAMDLTRAVPQIIDQLPPQTRAWVDGFIAGVNHVVAAGHVPHECRLLGIAPEPLDIGAFFAVARLASADITWMVAARLLPLRARDPAGWPAIWRLLQQGGMAPEAMLAQSLAERALGQVLRAGSNAAVLGGAHTQSGGAMIASDPHLGLSLPLPWLLAGLRAPGIAAAGLMIPGLPFVALGRNRDIAWGGTSLHAASSDLIDVGTLAPAEFAAREVTLRVRGLGTRVLRLRHCRYGPVVSDGLLFRSATPLALRWVGHRPSDELSAMLAVMQARDFAGFRDALQGFAIPGQMMLCAGRDGSAGRVAAAHAPHRDTLGPGLRDLIMTPAEADAAAEVLPGGGGLGGIIADGIAASANDDPRAGAVSLSYFYSPDDRARRIEALLRAGTLRDAAAMARLPLDTHHAQGLAARDLLLAALGDGGAPDAASAAMLAALRGWDGNYDVDSAGALALELCFAALARRVVPAALAAPIGVVWTTRRLIWQAVAETAAPARAAAMRAALAEAAPLWQRYRVWGAVHRYRPAHALAAVPVLGALLGRRMRGRLRPIAGSNDTLNKTGHGLVRGPHRVGFGACARHVADMGDPASNSAVLLGGQDGWIGSDTYDDQLAVWARGEMIALPLDGPAAAHVAAVTQLRAAGA